MSGRFSRGRRYSRARSYKAYPKRSSLIRRSVGNMRAAKRQNDLSNTTISGSSLSYQIAVPANADFGYQTFNVWDALNDSPMFRTLRQCYDQIRINNVKVKFSLLQALSMTGSNCPVFATVWDRNGFHPEQYKADTTDYFDGSNLDWDWETFASYSSFDKRSMSSGSAFNATISISPSSMAEKAMYVSTMDINASDDYGATSSEICSPLSNPALPFKPQVVTGIYVAKLNAPQTFIFSVDWEIDASFRGMHASKGQSSPRTDLMTHVLFNNQSPYNQKHMSGAIAMSSIFSIAAGPGPMPIPSNTSAIVLQYLDESDTWEVKFYRNPSGAPWSADLSKGDYWVNDLTLSSFAHFGKGKSTSDKIFSCAYAPSIAGQTGSSQCNYYTSAQVLSFEGAAPVEASP